MLGVELNLHKFSYPQQWFNMALRYFLLLQVENTLTVFQEFVLECSQIGIGNTYCRKLKEQEKPQTRY